MMTKISIFKFVFLADIEVCSTLVLTCNIVWGGFSHIFGLTRFSSQLAGRLAWCLHMPFPSCDWKIGNTANFVGSAQSVKRRHHICVGVEIQFSLELGKLETKLYSLVYIHITQLCDNL